MKKELEKLIRRMLKTFDDLGSDPMARIDARLWYDFYKKKVNKLFPPKKKK